MSIKGKLFEVRIQYRLILRKLYLKIINTKKVDKNATILCSNCLAGVVMHEYGMRFNTPTINLWIYPNDFVKFCSNLEEYLRYKVVEVKDSGKNYPVGRIKDINLYFLHYSNIEEAVIDWERRKKRVCLDNIYIIMTEKDGCTYEDLRMFDKLPYDKKVVFTSKKYPEIMSAYYIKGFEKEGCVLNLLEFKGKFSPFKFYDQFRFDKWLRRKI